MNLKRFGGANEQKDRSLQVISTPSHARPLSSHYLPSLSSCVCSARVRYARHTSHRTVFECAGVLNQSETEDPEIQSHMFNARHLTQLSILDS